MLSYLLQLLQRDATIAIFDTKVLFIYLFIFIQRSALIILPLKQKNNYLYNCHNCMLADAAL